MVDYWVDFTVRFEMDDEADFADKGFMLLKDGDMTGARDHFSEQGDDLLGAGGDWSMVAYDRIDRQLSAIVATEGEMFDEDRFYRGLIAVGPTHIVARTQKKREDKDGSFAWRKNKKLTPDSIWKDLGKENPSVALGHAIARDKKKEAFELVGKGVDPNGTFQWSSLLALAIWRGMVKVADALLDAGANPNGSMSPSLDNYRAGGQSALQLAVLLRKKTLFKRLLEAGADLNQVDSWSQSALHRAIGNPILYPMAITLIKQGATVNEPSGNGTCSPFLEFLTNADDYISTGDEKERNKDIALSMELFDLMLEHGADIHASCSGGNAQWYAQYHKQIQKRLAELGSPDPMPPYHER